VICLLGILLPLPIVLFAIGALCCREKTLALFEKFAASTAVAAALTTVGWLWTAYECDTIGIDVFDMLLFREQTGGVFVWALAAVLIVLTILWMRPYLPTRALMGIFMLLPGEAFKVTRPLLPDSGFAPVQILVVLLYFYAIVGMYGMFYPWRIEKAIRFILKSKRG